MSHIFISYSHKNQDFVGELEPFLEQNDFAVWTDTDDLKPGTNWEISIDEAIENAFAVLVVMTPDAKASEYVTYEWSYALGCRKLVIPIMLHKTPLHPRLDKLQYVDFTEDDISKPLNNLIAYLHDLEKEHIQTLVNSSGYKDRLHAISVLKKLPSSRSVPILIKMMQTDRSTKRVRPAAAKVLHQIDTPEARQAWETWQATKD